MHTTTLSASHDTQRRYATLKASVVAAIPTTRRDRPAPHLDAPAVTGRPPAGSAPRCPLVGDRALLFVAEGGQTTHTASIGHPTPPAFLREGTRDERDTPMQTAPLTTLAREAVEDLARTDPLSPEYPGRLAYALVMTARADDARAVGMAWLKGGATERARDLADDYQRTHGPVAVTGRRPRRIVRLPATTQQRPDRVTDPSAA